MTASGPKLAISGLDELFGEDQDKIDNGAWVPVRGLPKARIRIRSLGCYKARNKTQKIIRARAGDYRPDGSLPPELIDEDQVEMLSTVLVCGWEGFIDDVTKKPVICTPENVRALLIEYPGLRRYLYQRADASEVYAKEQREKIAGNSEPVSAAS